MERMGHSQGQRQWVARFLCCFFFSIFFFVFVSFYFFFVTPLIVVCRVAAAAWEAAADSALFALSLCANILRLRPQPSLRAPGQREHAGRLHNKTENTLNPCSKGSKNERKTEQEREREREKNCVEKSSHYDILLLVPCPFSSMPREMHHQWIQSATYVAGGRSMSAPGHTHLSRMLFSLALLGALSTNITLL